ncbi:hypothetical protein MAPG_07359 [Magnaporthiopsis poae ATCC 64411]|uniref:Uncharacterized protein n=1 Tax=Magnaporthiopsis poae (strain ATCC 64411 / 73-15) TaxID=644358 RepID=A0A0C4E4G5_MAGP6|nr:hypothetical protein MAPG_07359 [Magnaporthiopsis poae ATCC 64411]
MFQSLDDLPYRGHLSTGADMVRIFADPVNSRTRVRRRRCHVFSRCFWVSIYWGGRLRDGELHCNVTSADGALDEIRPGRRKAGQTLAQLWTGPGSRGDWIKQSASVHDTTFRS